MALRLHKNAYEYAQKLIKNRRYVLDQRSDWIDHKPSRTGEKKFIAEHGLAEFGKWHLGEDDDMPEGNKRRYSFPFGDFRNVHRCGILAAASRAEQYKHSDIELAATHLRGMLDALISEHGAAKEEPPYARSA
jgi:hypothetical protein